MIGKDKKKRVLGTGLCEVITIRCDKETKKLYNKVVKRKVMSEWLRLSLQRDFGDRLSVDEMILAERAKIGALELEKRRVWDELNSQVSVCLDVIRRLERSRECDDSVGLSVEVVANR